MSKLWQGSARCPGVADEGCRFAIYTEGDTEEEIDAAMTEVMLGHVDRAHKGKAVAHIIPMPNLGGVRIPAGLTGEEEDTITEERPRRQN